MRETGVVQSVEGGEALVKLKRHSACLGCRACSIAGSDMIIKAVATDRVKAGDRVTVEIDSASFVKAIAMVYLLPTAAFLAGILAGLKISPVLGIYEHKEILSIILGIAFISASLLLARRYGNIRKDTYRAKITEIINGGG